MTSSLVPGTPSYANRRRCGAYLRTVLVSLGTAVSVYVLNALLPWARPAGVYGGMGVMMLLPFLLLAACIVFALAGVVVLVVGRRSGLGWPGALAMAALAGGMSLTAFIMGYDARWGTQCCASSAKEQAEREAVLVAMAPLRPILQSAFDQRDIEPMRTALAVDSPLTPVGLLCLARERHWGTVMALGDADRKRGRAFLEQVAELAWQTARSPDMRLAVSLLAADAALRDGTAVSLQRWLARDIPVGPINWHRQVSALLDPFGPCSTPGNWPFGRLLLHNEVEFADKLAFLLAHGFPPPHGRLFEYAPLPSETLVALAAHGIHPHAVSEDGFTTVPLASAIRLALSWRGDEGGLSFRFDDDEIVAYVDVLLQAGSKPDDTPDPSHGAWQALDDVTQGLVKLRDENLALARQDQQRLDGLAPRYRDHAHAQVKHARFPDDLDLSRADLMRRISLILHSARNQGEQERL